MSDQILQFLGEIVAVGGGAAAIALLAFRFLAKSWLENKFAEALERVKHQHALEVQRLRVEIDTMLSGTLKVQEKEFETIPEAWRLLNEAVQQLAGLVNPMQTYPDLNRMTDDEVKEFLSDSQLLDTQKSKILNAAQRHRVDIYVEAIFWHKLSEVTDAFRHLHDHVYGHRIFLPVEIKGKFEKIERELWSAITGKRIGKQARDFELEHKSWEKLENEIQPLYEEIESGIYGHLRSHGREPFHQMDSGAPHGS